MRTYFVKMDPGLIQNKIIFFLDKNECATSPCVHGDCLDEVNGYTCSCISGYTGKICDIGN